MSGILRANGVCKYFGGLKAVENVDMEIARGDIFGIIGPNGAGKTTFFNICTGIYGPTKAAVSKFTKNAAMELALYGVRMVAIAPGYTDIGWPADSHLRQAEKRLPLKRFAAPEEIAKGVAFLASPDATYMTGCVLTMDGGATLPVVAANDFV